MERPNRGRGRRRMLRAGGACVTLALCVLVASACAGQRITKPSQLPTGVVCDIDGRHVFDSELAAGRRITAYLGQGGKTGSGAFRLRSRTDTIEAILREILAARAGTGVSDRAIDREVKRRGLDLVPGLRRADAREIVRRDLMFNALFEARTGTRMGDMPEVTQAQLQATYPRIALARLVRPDEASAQRFYQQLRAASADDFDAAVRAHTSIKGERPAAGHTTYSFPPIPQLPDLERALRRAHVGEVLPPYHTAAGWTVVRVLGPVQPGAPAPKSVEIGTGWTVWLANSERALLAKAVCRPGSGIGPKLLAPNPLGG